eukprot:4136661-Pyramimonas_sp.AAC.1
MGSSKTREKYVTIILAPAHCTPVSGHRRGWCGVFFANQQSLPREQAPVSVNTLHGLSFPFPLPLPVLFPRPPLDSLYSSGSRLAQHRQRSQPQNRLA